MRRPDRYNVVLCMSHGEARGKTRAIDSSLCPLVLEALMNADCALQSAPVGWAAFKTLEVLNA